MALSSTMTFFKMLLTFFLMNSTQAQLQRTMRVVTWNVADNMKMGGSFEVLTVQKVLGLKPAGEQKTLAYFDIYAITLQENCYMCDSDKFSKVADIFVSALNEGGRFQYEEIGHSATRVSTSCVSVACVFGMHGTTHMIVIAKRGMAIPRGIFHTNKCMSGFMKNSEKGIAMVKFQLRGSRQHICVGGVHLDSSDGQERRDCFSEFTNDHAGHLYDCSQIFFAGDFNTRTGEKGGESGYVPLAVNDTNRLLSLDEMKGFEPFGGQALLPYISAKTNREFSEAAIEFLPTYSVKDPTLVRKCREEGNCYRADRPPSWTDRIICSGCKVFWYQSLPIYKSDHLPVVGIFSL